jgi:CubicO group peptidase (beta-lactamase class C family)
MRYDQSAIRVIGQNFRIQKVEIEPMRRLIIFCVAAALSVFIPAAASAQQPSAQQPAAPSPAAEQRVREFVGLVNSGDRKAARAYAEQNLTPAALARVPAAGRVNTVSTLHDETRGVEIHSVAEPKPGQVEAVLRSRLAGEWWRLNLFLEPQPPHRIERLGMGLLFTPPAGQQSKKLSDEEITRELDAFLGKVVEADGFSGAVLLAKDGKVVFEKAYGVANKDFGAPNRTDTKFNLGSMNKMFTAVAVAQLAEAGKLSFDDPLAKFLPDFPDKEAAAKIKIKHLLTHTSGLGSYFSNERFGEGSRARFRTVDDFMELAKGDKLAFEPGTKWQYSNTGFLALGKVIEQVTGQSYFDYVRERIYKPAGMANSGSYDLDLVNPNLAVGYQKEYTDEGVRFRNNIFMHVIRGGPAGGGYSTVGDLLRFAAALRSGKLLSDASVKTLLTPKPELNSPNYGYGFGVTQAPAVAGHSGGFMGISANLAMFLDSGYTGVVLSNYGSAADRAVVKIQQLLTAGEKPQAN